MQTLPEAQAPGLNRRRIGDLVVTALSDGYLDAPFGLMSGIDAAGAEDALRSAGTRPAPLMNINVYVVQDGTRTILIDGGAGGINGWGGRLTGSLRAAGIEVGDIDTIVLTHAHPDHIGGLATPGGEPVFPQVQAVHVHQKELAFWRDDLIRSQAPDGFKPFFDVAQNAFRAYDDRLRPFSGEDVLPNFTAVALQGHTPGHTGYIIESQGESLLVWGDIVHFPDVQVSRPEVTVAFDNDADAAAAARRKVLDRVSADRLLVGGMHLTEPSYVRIERKGSSFQLLREHWSAALF